MSIVILLPAVICLAVLYREGSQAAFLRVYLPVLVLLPLYYYWKIPLLPPINFGEAVLVPLGFAIAFRDLRRWTFARADLWVLLFVFTTFYADFRYGRSTISQFDLFGSLAAVVVPYLAGRLLIEQPGNRVPALRTFVSLLFAVCVVSAYEYRMERNPFTMFWARFFPGEDPGLTTQIRWGFGRVAGPYSQSELAGMVFLAGLVFAMWLSHNSYLDDWLPSLRWLPFKTGSLLIAAIAITLLMTQARGPWLGALLAIPIALVGRAANIRRSAMVAIVLGSIAVGAAYLSFSTYLAEPTSSDTQQTAQYRKDLVPNYMPIAIRGGATGWGVEFPRVPGQGSIDDEYLFVDLTQGYLGLAALVLLGAEALLALLKTGLRAPSPEDKQFSFALIGIIAGILLTAGTVFLGNQAYQMFFLLIGWSQGIRASAPARQEAPKPAFEKVLT